MTTLTLNKLSIAEALNSMLKEPLPLRFTAYDGSAAGPEDSPYGIHLATERGLNYILTAPGDLGFGRAYVAGDLEVIGAPPGDPYEVFKLIANKLSFRRPSPVEALSLVRSLGISHLRPPAPPAQEAPSRLRRTFEGLRHSLGRDAEAIHHHYDVSNTFYEYVLGPSMTYTCAVFPTEDATLEEAQAEKYDLVARKLDLQEGQRLLDLGCGWGGMVRHAAREYGVHTLGVTLSREQATWAQQRIKEEGLDHLAEVRHMDYRHVEEREFDAVSSIGLTEHIGVKNYPAYFGFIRDRLRPQGRLLNHCITRHDNRWRRDRAVPRPLRVPGRRADRQRQDHHRGAERRPRGAARGELPGPLRQDPGRLVQEPRRQLGRLRRRGRRGHRPGLGALHGGVADRASSATRSSSTTCSRPRPTRTARAATRSATGGRPPHADPEPAH